MGSIRRQEAETYIRALRLDLFGRAEPPARKPSEAIQWLQEECSEGHKGDYQARVDNFKAIFGSLKAQMLAEVDNFPMGLAMVLGVEQDLVRFQRENGSPGAVLATTARLRRIAEAARYLKDFVPCLEGAAVMSILAGCPLRESGPARRAISVTPVGVREDLGALPPQMVKFAPGVTSEGPRGPALSPKESRFLDFVNRLIASGQKPPQRPGRHGQNVGHARYWECVRRKWNEFQAALPEAKGTDWSFKHWTSAFKRYTSTMDKITEWRLDQAERRCTTDGQEG